MSNFDITIETTEEKHGVEITYKWVVHFSDNGWYSQTDMTAYNSDGEIVGTSYAIQEDELPSDVRERAKELTAHAYDSIHP